jgi:AI-2 transport protein TqsA
LKNNDLLTVFLGILALFVFGVILLELKAVLLPFVVAILLSIIFKPVVIGLKKRRLPTAISLFMVLLVFFLLLFLLGWILFSSTESFVESMPRYEGKITAIINDFQSKILIWADSADISIAEFHWTDAVQFSSVTSAVGSGVGSFISFLSSTFLILLFMLFILAGSGDMADKIRSAFPEKHAHRIAQVVATVDTQVRQYLVTKTLISLGTGLLTFIILLILGVDFPLVWGFLAFILNYIPNIGSLIAVLFPFALSLLQFDSLTVPVLVLIFLGGSQTLMGNVIEPRIMAFSLNLSPLLILVSLIFWGWLWGLLGMMLAVPITASVKIIIENLEPLRPIAVLMSGRTEI